MQITPLETTHRDAPNIHPLALRNVDTLERDLKLEMHCHSILSDGRNSLGELIGEAKDRELDFLTLTDHDIISPKAFQEELRRSGIETCDSVEISSRNESLNKSLHLVSYSRIFKQSLHNVLDNTRNGKVRMYEGQIAKLRNFGLVGSLEGFDTYMQERHSRGVKSANKYFVTHYLSQLPGNKEKMLQILGQIGEDTTDIVRLFYSECLKREGKLYETYGYESEEYEPDVENVVDEVVEKSGGLVSMAHPNVTFGGNKGGIREFERTIGDYVKKGVKGIEINTMASQDWVTAIAAARRKYDLVLTFGSDCHEIGYDGSDGKHSTIGKINPHIPSWLVSENFGKSQKYFRTSA